MLLLGIATEQVAVTAISGALATVAIALLVVNFIGPLSVRSKSTPVAGLRFALAGSLVTVCLGAAFVGDRQGNWFDMTGHVEVTMAVVGLFGWLGITYIAVAEKLWPMFFLAHVPGRHLASRTAVWAVPIGVVVVSPGLLFNLPGLAWGGAGVLAAGLGAHLVSLASHVRHRRRKADLLKGAKTPIGPLEWHCPSGSGHHPACPSRSSTSAYVGSSASSCCPGARSRTRTSRSWCSGTRCVFSSDSFLPEFAIGL